MATLSADPVGAASDSEAEALKVLQRKVAQRDQRATSPANPTLLPNGQKLSVAAIEELYLNGQISARQFQKYVEAMEWEAAPSRPDPMKDTHEKAIDVLRKSEADPKKNPPPGPVIQASQIPLLNPSEAGQEAPAEVDFSEIETKMDRLLRLKAERDREMESNLVTLGAEDPSTPLTKRQRLDQLLRLHVYGKITEKEYNEKRAQIVAEPD